MKPEAFANCAVIWEGKNPNGNESFRIVDRASGQSFKGFTEVLWQEAKGSEPNIIAGLVPSSDPRYVAEQRKGHDSLGKERWGHVEVGSRDAFSRALAATLLGLLSDKWSLVMTLRDVRDSPNAERNLAKATAVLKGFGFPEDGRE